MGVQTRSSQKASASSYGFESSDREEQWERKYHAFAQMIRSEQSKNQKLLEDREFLLQLIHMQEEQWTSRLSLVESQMAQLKTEDAKWRQYYASKLDLSVEMKDNEVSLYKKYAEMTENDLEDYNTCILSLCCEIANLKDKLENAQNLKSPSTSEKDSKAEIKNLKQKYKTLIDEIKTLKKENEALILEKDFAWHQFKQQENNCITLRKSKNLELDQANEAAEKLRKNLEEMEASIYEKNAVISRLNGEIEGLKRSHADVAGTSKTVHETGTSRTLRSRIKRGLEISDSGMRYCSSKSQGRSSESNVKTPSLFSSDFKVPKLKH